MLMQMVAIIVLLLFYLIFPIFIIYLTHINKTINKIGAIVFAYATGLLMGNIGILPRPSQAYYDHLAIGDSTYKSEAIKGLIEAGTLPSGDLLVNQILSFQTTMSGIMVFLAIPLLLFSLDIKKWIKMANEALLSLLLGVVSLVIAIFAGYYLFGNKIEEGAQVAGMLTGVYTGGTPNMAAIGMALHVKPSLFIITNTYDMVISTFFLLFLMTIAQRVFNLFLPHFSDSKKHKAICTVIKQTDGVDNYLGMLSWEAARNLLIAFLIALVIMVFSLGLGSLSSKESMMAVTVISLTAFGILVSLIDRINKIENTFQLGMYFIVVFSLILSSQADIVAMLSAKYLNILLYVLFAVFGSMAIHLGLSWIFKVDTDTTIITMTGLTYSPPFVPAVAAAIRNKEVIMTGITNGILGYAIGNFLGISIGEFLK